MLHTYTVLCVPCIYVCSSCTLFTDSGKLFFISLLFKDFMHVNDTCKHGIVLKQIALSLFRFVQFVFAMH